LAVEYFLEEHRKCGYLWKESPDKFTLKDLSLVCSFLDLNICTDLSKYRNHKFRVAVIETLKGNENVKTKLSPLFGNID